MIFFRNISLHSFAQVFFFKFTYVEMFSNINAYVMLKIVFYLTKDTSFNLF